MLRALLTVLFLATPGFASEQLLLTPKNTIAFREVVTMSSVTQLQLELSKKVILRGKENYPIYLVMDSPGGDIYAGIQFIEFAKNIPNLKTVTIFAASMASAIVNGLPGERLVTGNGVSMFHRARGGFAGQFESGELESRLELWKSIVRNMEITNANRAGISLDLYKARVKDEWWVYGGDNLKLKTADKAIDIVCSADLVSMRVEGMKQAFGGEFGVSYSGCPTFRIPLDVSGDPEEFKKYMKRKFIDIVGA